MNRLHTISDEQLRRLIAQLSDDKYPEADFRWDFRDPETQEPLSRRTMMDWIGKYGFKTSQIGQRLVFSRKNVREILERNSIFNLKQAG